MSTVERIPDVEVARRLRSRREVDGLDYYRVLRRLAVQMTQVDLARSLGPAAEHLVGVEVGGEGRGAAGGFFRGEPV